MRVLVTGGTGFIGSHQVVALTLAGHEPIVLDDLSNSSDLVLPRLEELIGRPVAFARVDVRQRDEVRRVLRQHEPEAVIHFAARKHVPESVVKPVEYYDVNIGGLTSLLTALMDSPVRTLVFSSSGSVYGDADVLPIPEDHPHRPTNPYSATKSIGERILADLCRADEGWSVLALRYFNPAGAHPSGRIGEDPTGQVSNLLPVLMHVAVGACEELVIHGGDFDTPDGSGVRDYVHVVDVADAHVRALDHLEPGRGFLALNIGRGEGVSVLQMLRAVEEVTGLRIRHRFGPRRPGDVATLYADTSQAAEVLGMRDYADLLEICSDAWRWQSSHPRGLAG